MPKSDLVWIRSLQILSRKNQQPHSKDDIKALCALIGPQGVRAINLHIGKFISEKVL